DHVERQLHHAPALQLRRPLVAHPPGLVVDDAEAGRGVGVPRHAVDPALEAKRAVVQAQLDRVILGKRRGTLARTGRTGAGLARGMGQRRAARVLALDLEPGHAVLDHREAVGVPHRRVAGLPPLARAVALLLSDAPHAVCGVSRERSGALSLPLRVETLED